MTSRQPVFLRRHPVGSVVAALVVLLVAFVVLFDWNWVRPSIERYISKRTEREFPLSQASLADRLGVTRPGAAYVIDRLSDLGMIKKTAEAKPNSRSAFYEWIA